MNVISQLRGRPLLIAGLAALLVMALVSTVLANPAGPTTGPGAVTQDEDEDPDGPPSGDRVQRMVDDLAAVDIAVDPALAAEYAGQYGIGGAMRLFAWANEAGMDPAQIAGMFSEETGWGEIRRTLQESNPDLELHPGIGWIMREARGGGNGLGRENAPGQNGD